GASLGPEGPIVLICSGLASFIGRIIGLSRRHLRNLISIGAASAIATIFNTPIAALAFALEELSDINDKPLGPLAIATVTASVVGRALLGGRPIFYAPTYGLNHSSELIWYVGLGVRAGLSSAAFTIGLLKIRHFFISLQLPDYLKPAIGGVIVGLIGL